MLLTDKFRMQVPGDDTQGPWSFIIRVPSPDAADEICELLDPHMRAAGEEMVGLLEAMSGDQEAMDAITEKCTADGELDRDALRDELMQHPALLLRVSASREPARIPGKIKTRVAAMVLPLCEGPEGLTNDDSGGALDWDGLSSASPLYAREVLCRAAEEIYSHVRGQAQGVILKNLGSSSLSSAGGTTTSGANNATE